MRQEFVRCATYRTAYRRCPWASKALKVFGGFICFESVSDYYVAKIQR